MKKIACLILIGPPGGSAAEAWVHKGQLAASLDLLERLRSAPSFGEVTVMCPEPAQLPLAPTDDVRVEKSTQQDFAFGSTLLGWAQAQPSGPLAYFGGSSAPLLSGARLEALADDLLDEQGPQVITNNRFSSDWVMLKGINGAEEFLASLESDNPLGWGLQNQVGFSVEDLPASSASRTDIDTPMDLLMLAEHPSVGPNLQAWLDQVDDQNLLPVKRLRRLLATPATTLMVIGRSSAAAWGQLEAQTQVWTRLFVEERGMLASGRLRRREVRSMIAKYIESVGVGQFIDEVAEMADGLLWDNRVWLAATGGWPAKDQRFAADLGWLDDLKDERLRELTKAVLQADIPILCGGHGVVAGGLMALLEGN